MRKLAVAVVILVLVAGMVFALPHLVDANRYRGQVQTELQKRLNRPVQLGQIYLDVFPVRVKTTNVIIGEDPGYPDNVPFAQVAELDLSVKLFPLLRGKVEVKSLEMKRPQIELICNAQGVWNFSTAGHARSAPAANQPIPSQPQQSTKSLAGRSQAGGFTLGALKISDGQIAITDDQKRQPRAIYDHIDVTLKDYAPGMPFSLELTAHLPGSGSQTFRVTGNGGPINNAEIASTPFRGTLRLEEVSLSAAQTFLNKPALEGTDAVILGSTNLSNANGKITVDGSLKLTKVVVRGVEVGYPMSADFDLTDDLATDSLQIRKGAIKLGSTPVSLNGTIDTRPNPAVVDVNVSAANASIEEAARLAAAFGVAFSPNAKIAGQLIANIHAQGPTNNLAFTGSVYGRNLEVTGKQIAQPVRVPSVDLTMTPQRIQSSSFTATSGATSLAAQITIAQYTGNSPNVDASIKTVNGKVDELLNIAKAYGAGGVEGMSGSGAVSLDVHASGPIKNPDAMRFSGSGALQDTSLKMPSLAKPIDVHKANLQFTQNSVKLTNLSASLGSTNANGNLSIANFKAPRLSFALSVDKLNVIEMEQLAAGSNQKAPARKRAEASWSLVPAADAAPAPKAQPSFLQMATGTGTLAAGSIVYEQTVLTSVHTNVSLNHGVIQLNPLTAQIYGGQESGSVTVDTRPNPMTYVVNTKLTNVDANKLLASVSPVKDTLYGTLAATTNVTFATPDSGEIVQTLSGTMTMNLMNGKIMKLDLPGELAKIGKFSGVAPKRYTAISQMSSTFNINHGVVQTNDMKATLDVGSMAASGAINLVNQDLNLRVTTVLSKSFSQSVGGTAVGGYLNTVLANKNGELVLPVIVTGTTSHPRVAPDIQQIAKMKLSGLLNGKGGNGLGGLLGRMLGQQQGQQPPAKPGQKQQ
jgi:uncharacterized protein involved in outer membrane biogenesis